MKQTILFGNGINLLASSEFKWEHILNGIGCSNLGVENYNTYKYEAMLINQSITKKGNESLRDVESQLKKKFVINLEEQIEKAQGKLKQKYSELFQLPVDYFLTTNYDDTYRNFLSINYHYKEHTYDELAYNMRRKLQWVHDKTEECIYLWPIHGTISDKKTMMLGFDHYCGSIARISNYLNNGRCSPGHKNKHFEEYLQRNKKELDSPYIRFRMKTYPRYPKINYWVDTFFVTDVHIMGLGMSFDEIDLWWLLNKRKRLIMSNIIKCENKIYFYGYASSDVRNLLNLFGVDVSYCETNEPSDWSKLHESNIAKIKSYLSIIKRA